MFVKLPPYAYDYLSVKRYRKLELCTEKNIIKTRYESLQILGQLETLITLDTDVLETFYIRIQLFIA